MHKRLTDKDLAYYMDQIRVAPNLGHAAMERVLGHINALEEEIAVKRRIIERLMGIISP